MLDLLKFGITAKNRSGSAFSEVKRDLQGVKGMMASVSAQGKRLGRNLRNIGAGMSVGVTAPIAAMGKSMVVAYEQQLQAEKAVATAITSTGGAAGKTLDDLKGLASGLQAVTTYGDEDILRNVTAPLLTFTKIQGDVFDQAQASVLDYATLLKTDLKSASIQVGKALNDPVKGVAALGKAGVQFSEEQKGMIKSLVETGDVAGAQSIILKELQQQFVGQAKAMADTPLGQWEQVLGLIGDVKEQLGEQIVPFLKPLVENVRSAVNWFGALSPEVKRNIVVVGGLAAAVGPLVTGLGLMVMGVTAVGGALATMGSLLLANPVIAGIAAIAGGAYLIYRNWDGVSGWFANLWGGRVKGAFVSGWEILKATLLNYSAPGILYRNWEGIAEWFSNAFTKVKSVFATSWEGIAAILDQFGFDPLIKAKWTGLGEYFTALLGDLPTVFTQSWEAVRNVLVNYTAEELVYRGWRGIGAWFASLSGEVSAAFQLIWEAIKTEVTTWPARMVQTGKDVVGGFIAGMNSRLQAVESESMRFGNKAISGAKKSLEVKSPSRVFMRIGQNVAEGLALGVRNNSDLAVLEITGLTDRIKDEADKSTSFMGRFRDGAKSVFTSVLTGAQNLRGALAGVLGGWANQLFTSGTNLLFDTIWPFEKGGAVQGGKVLAYARGGVVSGPTTFPMAGGNTGLMGEAGPEAIMPLSRGPDGRLGVQASGGRRQQAEGPQEVVVRFANAELTIGSDGKIEAYIQAMADNAVNRAVSRSVSAVDARMRRTKSFGQPA